jgi:hypothetical protein
MAFIVNAPVYLTDLSQQGAPNKKGLALANKNRQS